MSSAADRVDTALPCSLPLCISFASAARVVPLRIATCIASVMYTTRQPDGSLTHRFVEVEGLKIHTVEAGVSRGADLLLVHGWPQDWSAFEPVLRRVGNEGRVAAIDLPGVGASEMLPPSFAKRVLARYVRGVVRTLGLKRVMIAGHDVGGQIAYAYVVARGLRVVPCLRSGRERQSGSGQAAR